MGIISIVGMVSLTIEAIVDFLSLLSSSSELAILLVATQWLITPEGDVLSTVLYVIYQLCKNNSLTGSSLPI